MDGSDIHGFGTVGSAGGIALDVSSGRIYWAGPGGVYRGNTDGTAIETLISYGSTNYDPDVALDLAHGKMYFTNPGTSPGLSAICIANLDGSDSAPLIALVLLESLSTLRAGRYIGQSLVKYGVRTSTARIAKTSPHSQANPEELRWTWWAEDVLGRVYRSQHHEEFDGPTSMARMLRIS